MKTRILWAVALFAILLVPATFAALAQDAPVVTPEVQSQPPIQVGGQDVATLPPPADAGAPSDGSAPAEGSDSATLGLEQSAALPILIAARDDLELIATQSIGSGLRPVGWDNNLDPTDPDYNIKLRINLELLASSIWGDPRPADWFGVVATVPIGIARDIRHDLELVADEVMGRATIRPAGWQGDNPIYRCGRATQAILTMLEADNLTIPVDVSQEDYCKKAELDAAIYVERNVLQPLRTETLHTDTNASYPFQAETAYVVAFLDRDARHKIGVLPVGTGFDVLGRSTVGFSNMTLIEGRGFRVYVDWTTTPLTLDQFNALPDFDTIGGDTRCDAEWCGVNVN